MKKLSLLVGTLGGAMAGYLFSNKKLRDQLTNAKDAEEAAKILGRHMQADGKKLGKHVQDLIENEEVQNNLQKAKQFTKRKVDEAKVEMQTLVDKGKTTAKKKATKAKGKAKTAAKKGAAKAKRTVKKQTKKVKRAVTKKR